MDMSVLRLVFFQYLLTFGWALVGAVSMGVGLGIALRIFDSMTKVDEAEELRKGNTSVAIVLGAVVIAMGMVVSETIRAQ